MITNQVKAAADAPAPAAPAPARPAAVAHSLFFPAGAKDVRQVDLYREFLRWPTFLWIPLSVAVLVAVGLHHQIAAVPCGVLLATIATLHAARRACARVTARAALAAMVPQPRAHGDR